MIELKPCPFCGRKPIWWRWNHGCMVECYQKDHRVQCEAKDEESAAKAWNRRNPGV